MDRKKRRAISSSLGKIDLGEIEDRGVLRVEDPTEQALPEVYQEDYQQFQQPQRRRPNPDVETRQFSVNSSEPEMDDENIQDLERRLMNARQEKKDREQRAPASAIQRLEILTGIGRLVRDVEIEGVNFSLKSLKSKEIRIVMEQAALAKTNVGEALTIRDYTLAFAIYKIDDRPFEQYIGSNEYEDKVETVENLDASVTKTLWKEYSAMINEHQEALKQDLGKNSEEILDNVKKS